ncbi:polysaccharide deacetylase family protein [Streptomyces sp. NPDC050610]|uniref:polysaccharide deacetylase family protein n=1 Tax=Streptomyces sp. NPDC050610 TaxID=3157097 RepID=UPI003422BF68
MARLTAGRRRMAMAVAAAVVATAGITGTVAVVTHSSGGDKGQQQVRQDEPAARPAPPKKIPLDIVHATESGGKAVNITIDDGPDPVWTPKVLELLKQNGVKATFCMIGPQAKEHPELVKRVVAAGHRLCDHTIDHNIAMDHRSVGYQKQQILDAQQMIEGAAGGAKVQYYRAPGGAFTPDSRKIAAAHGMRPLGWNIDTKDFEHPGVQGIINTVKQELSNGPTILFHDGGGERSETVAALNELLPWLKEQGYGFSFPQVH